ncbi:fibroblast growth factor 21-like [Rhinophrynus dorsalis]
MNSSRISLAYPIRDTNPLLGFHDQVRLKHLYTDNERTHLHLQILPNGEVSGTQEKNPHSVMEIKAVKPSIVVIRGIRSSRYLCMDPGHHLYGSEIYKEEDCNFREEPLSNGYNLYFSEKHSAQLSLNPLKDGRKMERFMPLENTIPLEYIYIADDPFEQFQDKSSDLGSDDPLAYDSLPVVGGEECGSAERYWCSWAVNQRLLYMLEVVWTEHFFTTCVVYEGSFSCTAICRLG